MITYDNIRKIATGQGDNYTIGCLLDYLYFKENYKLTATDLSKQQKLYADPKAMQKISFTRTPEKKSLFKFLKRKSKIFMILFCFNKILI